MPAGEIERFVVEQIRAVGQHPALVADAAERAREQAAAIAGPTWPWCPEC